MMAGPYLNKEGKVAMCACNALNAGLVRLLHDYRDFGDPYRKM